MRLARAKDADERACAGGTARTGARNMNLPVLNNQPAPEQAWSESEREALAHDVRGLVRGEVRFGYHDRMLYSTDASIYQVEPIGVVVPADIEDAAAVVALCHARSVAILPRGGGTSLAGQCTARAVVLAEASPLRTPAKLAALVVRSLSVVVVQRLSRQAHKTPALGAL